MPERLDSITIQLCSRDLIITWTERQQLLEEVRDRPRGDPTLDRSIRKAFEDVGAGRPVVLTPEEERYLLGVLKAWPEETETLRQGLLKLRDALSEELPEAEQ
jgi:hypothetical protein